MKITLLKKGNTVVRSITSPVVQLDVANRTLTLSGKDEVKMDGGGVYTGQMQQMFAKEGGYVDATNPTAEQTAMQARNSAKEVAVTAFFDAVESALTAYATACYAIENPVNPST
jgi:hypothetical protein